MKIGSLFDGSGGFPLAATMCGMEPVWASEIEPYPIAVTRSRFPHMKHLGSVTEVKGYEVEPVDVITFGSPCQDLSVAGKRAGLKHTENGDDETTRSGLFMEAVRIIKEMREATNGVYPRFAVWENVPGAFSSNKGEDFRIVLEEIIKIVEPTALMPEVPKNGWPYSDVYCGDGWSLAYRVLDAQYWGVPQRRRRIYLVADFRGQRAGKVSFEREGLRGYFAQSGSQREAAAGDAENGTGAADRGGDIPYTLKIRSGCEGGGKGALWQEDKSATISTLNDQYLFQPVCYNGENITSPLNKTNPQPGDPCHTLGTDSRNYLVIPIHDQATRFSGKRGDKSDGKGNGLGVGELGDPMNTLTGGDRHAVCYGTFAMQGFGDYKESDVASGIKARDYKDSTDLVVEENPIVIDRAFFNQGQNALYPPQFYTDGTVPTIVARGPSAVCVRYIVRRLTPTECARLQDFPDEWGHPDTKNSLTDEEYAFWLNVRNTHAEINGKAVKEYTRDQMLTWYNKLHTDSAEYKLWGNGIALPCALYVMQGIAEVLHEPRN